ncbi:Hypothetical_protein [Hexamita inflata]|uniref:Hypothetical_protein n=1 Tax=Hexamita inflata TaxID=28002 RepID=A0AA86QC92_9EUKA|nr:Hypothetical protein HINF_LOCUS44061 [Hexamita inflata]
MIVKYLYDKNERCKYNINYINIISTNDLALRLTLELKRHCWNTSFVLLVISASGSSPHSEMRLGQIGCGRQNPPVQSAELASSRIRMAKGMPSTSLQDWKAATAPLLPQKRRWYDTGGLLYRSACTKQPRYAHGCLYPSCWLHCGGAPNVHRCIQNQ